MGLPKVTMEEIAADVKLGKASLYTTSPPRRMYLKEVIGLSKYFISEVEI